MKTSLETLEKKNNIGEKKSAINHALLRKEENWKS
jgi:hypothetical protein